MTDKTICNRCLFDSTIPGVAFDPRGECNYCKIHDALVKAYPRGEEGRKKLDETIARVKARGRGKTYDCVVGLSGGTDSTWLLYYAKQAGLRPLAVHFDNGWDSEISVNNIRKAISALDVDLQTYVVDWDEFRDILKAYLKSSLPWADAPTDIGLTAALYRIAAEEGIKYIFVGNDFRSEGKQPTEWTHADGRQIRHIHKTFGSLRMKTFPNLTLFGIFKNAFVRRIRLVRPLYHLEYNKQEARRLLEEKIKWEDYGGHHYESIFTRFVYSVYLPEKYGIDKRIVSLSAQVRSGVLKRDEALVALATSPVSEKQRKSDIQYVKKKLGLSDEEFDAIMKAPPKSFLDYPSYYPMIRRFAGTLRYLLKFILPWTPMMFYEMEGRKLKGESSRLKAER